MRVFLLTVGTRGDIQPFLALGRGLREAGHEVTVCTTAGFAPFVERHGLGYAHLDNDLVELTTGEAGRKAIENFGGGPVGKMRWIVEASRRFKPIFRRLLAQQWQAAQGAELVVFHPNAVGGIHIAEALGVPAAMADPMPTWIPTGDFPNFVFPDLGLGRGYNRMTYRLLPALTRGMYGSVVSQWRRETLGLASRPRFAPDFVRTDGLPVAVLQCFSEQVVPRPTDWPENAFVTGYWFLDDTAGWRPPPELEDFLSSGPPPVLVGFGSMAGEDPEGTGRTVLEALARSGERGIVVTGWGGLKIARAPADVLVAETIPYEWILPRVAAVVHHGGAGTTSAALRAGKPNVVCPFVADQPFWGARVASLGVGPEPIPQKRLTAERLSVAIRAASSDAEMKSRAAALGSRIRAEDGIAEGIRRLHELARKPPHRGSEAPVR